MEYSKMKSSVSATMTPHEVSSIIFFIVFFLRGRLTSFVTSLSMLMVLACTLSKDILFVNFLSILLSSSWIWCPFAWTASSVFKFSLSLVLTLCSRSEYPVFKISVALDLVLRLLSGVVCSRVSAALLLCSVCWPRIAVSWSPWLFERSVHWFFTLSLVSSFSRAFLPRVVAKICCSPPPCWSFLTAILKELYCSDFLLAFSHVVLSLCLWGKMSIYLTHSESEGRCRL